jgi:hypothetical protein
VCNAREEGLEWIWVSGCFGREIDVFAGIDFWNFMLAWKYGLSKHSVSFSYRYVMLVHTVNRSVKSAPMHIHVH